MFLNALIKWDGVSIPLHTGDLFVTVSQKSESNDLPHVVPARLDIQHMQPVGTSVTYVDISTTWSIEAEAPFEFVVYPVPAQDVIFLWATRDNDTPQRDISIVFPIAALATLESHRSLTNKR